MTPSRVLPASLPFVAILAVTMVAGCGRSTYPVSGRIVFADGTPATELDGFIVAMESAEHTSGATGVVQPDGTFRVGTQEVDDGAKPGKYKVSLTPPDPPLDQPAPKPIIDPKYSSMATTDLEVEVTAGSNEVTLTVERAKP